MFGFFRKKKKSSNPVPYDKKLIVKYEKEHKQLVNVAGKVYAAAKAKNSNLVRKELKVLRMGILGHFMNEDLSLYRYLKHKYRKDPRTYELVHEFEMAIKDIQKEVFSFLDEYSAHDAEYDANFKIKFDNIVSALVSRIETEEASLYPLYVEED